jgi:Cu2+-exporting ATPase
VAEATGTDRWIAELAPEDKRQAIRELGAVRGPVAMVGDGLNDGPALAAADVGIAVGSAAGLARETANIVLPRVGIALLPELLFMARRLRRIVAGNLVWAFGYNAVAIALAAAGVLKPLFAAVLMVASSLFVIVRSSQRSSIVHPRRFRLAERARDWKHGLSLNRL